MDEWINSKKPKTAINDRLREVIWMIHHGVHEKDAICMCARNKDVDIINEKYFNENKNEAITFTKQPQYFRMKDKT